MLTSITPLAAQSNDKCGNPYCSCGECKCEPAVPTERTIRVVRTNNHPTHETTIIDFGGWQIVEQDYRRPYNHYGRYHTTRIRFNGRSFVDAPWSKRDRTTFLPYIAVGYNGLVGGMGQMNLADGDRWLNVSSRSRNFRLMLIQGSCRLGRWGALRTGLELEVENFRWDENIALRRDDHGVVVPDMQFTERGIRLHKTKLVSSWFNVPLTLHITPGHRFDIYGGIVGGLRLKSYQKLKASDFGKKHIKHENLNLRNFHFGYTAGFYYGRWGLYASYYPHSIFRSGGGANARAVAVGVTIKTGCGK